MAEAENLINTLRQGCAQGLSRELVAHLCEQDRVISEIRTVTALPDVPLEDLPSLIENLLSELADRQIRADIEPSEFVADQGSCQ